MFKTVINNTPFLSGIANELFNNITGHSWDGDCSFITTLRALVAPKVKEGEYLRVEFAQSNYTAQQIANIAPKQVVRSIYLEEYVSHGTITVHNFVASREEDRLASLEAMKSSFCDTRPGWHQLEKVTDFFIKTFNVLCFIHPDTRRVVLFIDNMNMSKMHYLQCSIFAFLPWYFDPEAGVSPEEMELIKSFREKTSIKYEDCISRIAEKYDFNAEKIRKLLTGFETRFEERELKRIREKIEQIDREIGIQNDGIKQRLVTRRNDEIRILGLEHKIAQGGSESEMMEYFLCNKNLVLEAVSGSDMIFSVKGYVEYYDEDMAKTVIDRDRSYIYRPDGVLCEDYIPAEDMKRLMYAVFINQTIGLKFCGAYRLYINNQEVDCRTSFAFGTEFREYIPNPHIDKFNCLGNYLLEINTLLKNNDYIGAVEQCVASCKSLNFADSAVMGHFMKQLYGLPGYTSVNNRCIELPDGTVVTVKAAVKYLKEQEAGTDE